MTTPGSSPGVSAQPPDDPGADRELMIEAATLVLTRQFAAATHMQRNLRVGLAKAMRLLDLLESWGVVGPALGTRSRDVLLPSEALDDLIDRIRGGAVSEEPANSPASPSAQPRTPPPADVNADDAEAARRDELRADLTALIQMGMDAWLVRNDPAVACGPSMARTIADDLVAAGFRRVAEDPEPNAWRIEVTVPLRLSDVQRQEVFDAVCSAVEDWEPAPGERDGWDADVSAHAVYDEFLSDDGGAALRGGEQQ